MGGKGAGFTQQGLVNFLTDWDPGYSQGRSAGSYSKAREEPSTWWKRGRGGGGAASLDLHREATTSWAGRVTLPLLSLTTSPSSPWRVTKDLTKHSFVSDVGFLVDTESPEHHRISFS